MRKSAPHSIPAAALLKPLLWLGLIALATACSTTPTPGNEPIAVVDDSSGYRRMGNTWLEQGGIQNVLAAEILGPAGLGGGILLLLFASMMLPGVSVASVWSTSGVLTAGGLIT